MANNHVEYDPNQANALLDAMGLDKRLPDGTRLFWNGQPFIMDVNVPTQEVPLPAVRLVCQYWQNIGINAQLKLRTGNMMYRMEEMGTSDLRVHKEGGNYFGPFEAGFYYPSHPAESVQWYQWANSCGAAGAAAGRPPSGSRKKKDSGRRWSSRPTWLRR